MQTGDHDRSDALPAGTAFREYTLEAILGRGGFGIVYRARHNELGEPVAIREFLPIELAVREGAAVRPRNGPNAERFEDALCRFEDESRALIDCGRHSGVVRCRDFFRAHGTGYLVMDYEDGESLAEVLERREAEGRPFGESDLLAVMEPLLEGLTRVHEAGLLHGDINPSNILIRRRDAQPVLIDFAVAKRVSARHGKLLAPFTRGYAALEQVAGVGEVGPRTDIYAIGTVMWRMVAGGRPPGEPPNPLPAERRLHAALTGKPDPLPSAYRLGEGRFNPSRLAVIDRCVRLKEADRFQSCGELLEALTDPAKEPTEDQVLGETVQLPTDPGKRRAWKVAVVAVAAAVGIAFALTQWRNTDEVDPVPGSSVSEATSSRPSDPAGDEESGAPVGQSGDLLADRDAQLAATPGGHLRDCHGCPELVVIPQGAGLMGSPAPEDGQSSDESPQHQVNIAYPLAVGIYEVTFREWDICVDGGGCNGYSPDDHGWGREWRPVVGVSWGDAQAYLQWISARTGLEYRLPSEAEWEFVARAGTQERYYVGEEISPDWANYGWNVGMTLGVGSYQANAFDLHDVHGNVWEWVADCWNGSYDGAPTDGSAWTTGDCTQRVLRGGSWHDSPTHLRSSNRHKESLRTRNPNVGFRVVRTLYP